MEKSIFAGTYHKTGSVWIYKSLLQFSNLIGKKFFFMSKHEAGWQTEAEKDTMYADRLAKLREQQDHGFFFDGHTMMPNTDLMQSFNGFRVVRDPRDVLVSAINYHVRSEEKWLHVPQAEWGGMTYAEKLRSLDAMEDKIEFELNNSAGRIIRRMASFENPGTVQTLKYEDLIADTEMKLWTDLLETLGFDSAEIEAGRKAFWNNSLFGGLAASKPKHVSDGSIAQWAQKLTSAQIDYVQGRIGEEVAVLGYE